MRKYLAVASLALSVALVVTLGLLGVFRRTAGTVGAVGAASTFISANGTTANGWQLGGPSGPGFVVDAGALDILPNVSLAGAPGTGALQLGQMTGSTALPTGSLS